MGAPQLLARWLGSRLLFLIKFDCFLKTQIEQNKNKGFLKGKDVSMWSPNKITVLFLAVICFVKITIGCLASVLNLFLFPRLLLPFFKG